MLHLKKLCLIFILFFTSLNTWAACPSLAGTYIIEAGDNTNQLIIQKDKGAYTVSIRNIEGDQEQLPVIDSAATSKEEEPLFKCAILVEGMGIVKKVDKGTEFSVTAESQNYMTKRVASTGYIIYVASGFYSNIINLEKIK